MKVNNFITDKNGLFPESMFIKKPHKKVSQKVSNVIEIALEYLNRLTKVNFTCVRKYNFKNITDSTLNKRIKNILIKILHRTLIKEDESKHLKILTRIIKNEPINLNEADKKSFNLFLQKSLGNRKLNRRFLALGRKKFPDISNEATSFMATFSYKSKAYTQIDQLLLKLNKGEKITLNELGKLTKLSSLLVSFKKLEDAGILEDNGLKILFERIQEANQVVQNLEKTFQEEIKEHYKSGDLVAWDTAKWYAYMGKNQRFDFEVLLMNFFITPVGHASYLYCTKPNQDGVSTIKQSHVVEQYTNAPLMSYQVAIGDVWRLKVPALVDKKSELYDILNKIYIEEGKNLDAEVQEIYEESARYFHEEKQSNFMVLNNEESRRFASGKADYGLKGGHKRKQPRKDDFMNIHKKFSSNTQQNKQNTMICSEFVTKSIISSLIETDKKLVAKIQEYAKREVENRSVYISPEIISQIEDPSKLHFIDLPYDNRERIKRIHPGRMLDLLLKKECLEKIPPPSFINNVFVNPSEKR